LDFGDGHPKLSKLLLILPVGRLLMLYLYALQL